VSHQIGEQLDSLVRKLFVESGLLDVLSDLFNCFVDQLQFLARVVVDGHAPCVVTPIHDVHLVLLTIQSLGLSVEVFQVWEVHQVAVNNYVLLVFKQRVEWVCV